MSYSYLTLDNGIRFVHKETLGNVAHLGIIINTGSRDEADNQHGIAHFIEHVIFKGTNKRKAYHILSRLEDVGGELDAYTTKEETCIYTAFLNEHYDRALELLADIVFNSTFPEKELEKEKEVIIDEINSYKDSPADLIFDDFEELIFNGHPIGRNILGEPESLIKYTRDDLLRFVNQKFNTNEIVICSVGNKNFNNLKKQLEKYFSLIKPNIRNSQRQVLNSYIPNIKELEKDTYQSHCIIGNRAYSVSNKRRLPLELLNNILGGPGMNSRLNLALREKHGFTYNIESFYNSYTDTGIFGVYFGTDAEKVEKSLKLIKTEIKKLQNKALGVLQLEKAKKQMIGQMAIASENKSNLMLNIGRSYLLFNKIDSLETVYNKINKITSLELMDVANDVLNFDKLSVLIYK